MIDIADKNFLHIHKMNGQGPFWKINDEFNFGNSYNHYWQGFLKNEIGIPGEDGIIHTQSFLRQYLRNPTIQQNNTAESIVHFAETSLNEYTLLVRETIFEQVRIMNYNHLPSRQKCAYLIDEDDENCLNRWHSDLCSNSRNTNDNQGIIFQVCCSGQIFIGDTKYLYNDTYSVNQYLKSANHYWKNSTPPRPENKELLFTGNLKVKQIIRTSLDII